MKYKAETVVVGKNGEVDLNEGEIPLNTFYDQATGGWRLVLLIPVKEEEETEEEETEEEKKAREEKEAQEKKE